MSETVFIMERCTKMPAKGGYWIVRAIMGVFYTEADALEYWREKTPEVPIISGINHLGLRDAGLLITEKLILGEKE